MKIKMYYQIKFKIKQNDTCEKSIPVAILFWDWPTDSQVSPSTPSPLPKGVPKFPKGVRGLTKPLVL